MLRGAEENRSSTNDSPAPPAVMVEEKAFTEIKLVGGIGTARERAGTSKTSISQPEIASRTSATLVHADNSMWEPPSRVNASK
jgi:hypothetical protein